MNGMTERWNRMLKDQAIHEHILQNLNLEEVRAPFAAFVGAVQHNLGG